MADWRRALSEDEIPAAFRNVYGDRTEKPLSVKGAEIGVEFTPAGTIFGLNDIKNELQKENPDYYKIGMMAGVEAIGLIPGLDKVAIEAIRAGAKKVGLDKVADQTDAIFGGPKAKDAVKNEMAGFTGQNPPTYIPKDEPVFDPDGIYETKDGIVKFREPIAEFTRKLTMANSFPSKGMTGAEFLRLLEKNAESIPPSSYKEGLVDKNKRYTREELLDVVTKSPAGLPESLYYTLADLGASPAFSGYQRQTQVGFTGYPRYPEETSYFSIPILSRTSGNTFKANSQHFDASTTAHVRGSFIDPMVGFNVDKTLSPEFKNIVGRDQPYLLVEEIQSDLLQKGYRKPKNSFDSAFDMAANETMAGSEVTFQEAYGDLTNELKSLVKTLDSEGVVMPEEPVRLQRPYRAGVLNHPQFKDRRKRDFLDSVRSRGTVDNLNIITFEEIKDYIDVQGVNSMHIYTLLDDIADNANRFGYLNRFESIALQGPDGKIYNNVIVKVKDPNANNGVYVKDVQSPDASQALEDFDEYTKQFGLNYDDLVDTYEEDLNKYYAVIDKEVTDRKLDKDEVDGAFINGLYERFLQIKKDQRLLGDDTNTALPPVRKNKQTVEEALKLLIAKADQEGVDKIVIPPANKIAEARNRTIDPSDKGDRFYRTYVTDLDKALKDLEKNYPVTIHRDIELPYRNENQPTRTAAEQHLIDMGFEDMVNDNPNAVAANAADDAGINDDDLFTVEEGNQFFDLPEGFFDDVPDQDAPVQQPKTKTEPVNRKGIIIDISKLREQFQVDKPRQFAEGGAVGDMNRQMELFARGGLKDDGMNMDPVSGNEVPSGSLAEEVRDDIPAQLSEGEYVVPADVVRYYGVKHFEDLRNKAKKGLTQMEADGRIGGEPMMDEDITEQDIAAFERMLAIGAAEGGLMDKMAKAVKSNKMINDRANAKGLRVGYAAGGMTKATYDNPTRIDQVIDRVMGAARKDPNIMQELTKRGIEVSRTTPQMNPQEMDKANPMPETRKAFFQGGVTGLPMAPSQQLGGITPGMSQDEIYKYITTPTTIDPMYGVPGGSYIGAGVPVAPSAPAPEATTPAASPEYCASLGMMFDAEKNMCVPRPASSDDGPDIPVAGDGKPAFQDWGKELNFTDYESMEEWAKGLSQPMKGGKLAKVAAAAMPGPIGLIAGVAPSVDALKDISDLNAARIIAKARGDDKMADMLEGYIEDRIKTSSGLVDMLDELVASGKQKADAYARRFNFDSMEDVMSIPSNRNKFTNFTTQYGTNMTFKPATESPGLSGDTAASQAEVEKEQVVMQQTVKPAAASPQPSNNNNDDDDAPTHAEIMEAHYGTGWSDTQTDEQEEASDVGFGSDTGGWTPEGFDFGQNRGGLIKRRK